MSNRIYAWFLAELPAHRLARHRGLLLDVIRLESATARWRGRARPSSSMPGARPGCRRSARPFVPPVGASS
jgi:hypothetical protein